MYHYYKVPAKQIMRIEYTEDENGEPVEIVTDEVESVVLDVKISGSYVCGKLDEASFIVKTKQKQDHLEEYQGEIDHRWERWQVR